MCRRRIVLLDLLLDDEALGDDDARRREERECQAQRQPQVLRLMGEVVERVDDDEADGAERRES